MKKVTLNRNGQTCAMKRETSDLKAGRFELGEHVMLSITGDCCYHKKSYAEYVVAKIEPCDRFGGDRQTVTFERVETAKEGRAVVGCDFGSGESSTVKFTIDRTSNEIIGIHKKEGR